MRILFDQGIPVPLRQHLAGHDVITVFELGWADLTNGDLLERAERSFHLLLTTDQNLRYQQNLERRNLAIIVLMTTSWPRIRAEVARVVETVSRIQPGKYIEVNVA
jgi:predicted nuclease of predicted toxin-antitoxin system